MDRHTGLVIEQWWRHLGVEDRMSVSGMPRTVETGMYFALTDDWWDARSPEEKLVIYGDHIRK